MGEWDPKLEYHLFDAIVDFPPRSSGLDALYSRFLDLSRSTVSYASFHARLCSYYDKSVLDDEEGTEDAEERGKRREKSQRDAKARPAKRNAKRRREEQSLANEVYGADVPDEVVESWLGVLKDNGFGQLLTDKRSPPHAYEAIRLAVKKGKMLYAAMPQFVYGALRDLGDENVNLQDVYTNLRENWALLSEEGSRKYSLANKTWYSTVRSTLSSFPLVFKKESESARWSLHQGGSSADIFASKENPEDYRN